MKIQLNTHRVVTNLDTDERVIRIGDITFNKGMYFDGTKKDYLAVTRQLISGNLVQSVVGIGEHTSNGLITTKQTHTITKDIALQLLNISQSTGEVVVVFNTGVILNVYIDVLNTPFKLTPTHENSEYFYFDLKVLF